MTRQVIIECGTGTDAYTVIVTAENIDIFHSASKQKQVQNRCGEELIAALLDTAGGGISKVERKNKQRRQNDGPNGEPGVQLFGQNGKIIHLEHYKDGALIDGPNGEPCIQQFDFDGQLKLAWHVKNREVVKQLNTREIADYQVKIQNAAKVRDITKKVPAIKIRP